MDEKKLIAVRLPESVRRAIRFERADTGKSVESIVADALRASLGKWIDYPKPKRRESVTA